MNEKIIKEYIRALEHIIGYMRNVLEEETKITEAPTDTVKELTDLRMLSKSDLWPLAVPADLLCGEDEDSKLARATGILQEFITTDVERKKFLDFGCGEGHVPFVAASLFNTELSIGYDVKEQMWFHFEKNQDLQNLLLTTDWAACEKNGPYDVILVNDVLDHSGDPLKALRQIKSVKNPDTGKVFIRFHPWASRHGTHLYKTLNRAYLHLVFSPEELYAMGFKEMPTQPALDPIALYKHIIQEAGFSIIKEDLVTQPVETFFTHNPDILRRIKAKWATSKNPDFASGTKFPREIMEIQFADFVLI